MKKIILTFLFLIIVAVSIFLGVRYKNGHSQTEIFSNQKSLPKQDQVQYLEEAKAKEVSEVYFNEQDLKLKTLGSDSDVLDLQIPADEQVNFYRFSADNNSFLISTQKKDSDKAVVRQADIKDKKVQILPDGTFDSCPEKGFILRGDNENKTIVDSGGKEVKSIKTDLNRISCVNDYYYLWKSDEFSSNTIESCKGASCKKAKLPGNLIDFQSGDIGAIIIFDPKLKQYSLLGIDQGNISRIVNNILPIASIDKTDIWGVSKNCSLYKVTSGKAEPRATNYGICNAVDLFSFNDSILLYDGSQYITVKK